MIRILIADDQPLSRQGLAAILSLADDMEIIGEAESGLQAITQSLQLTPDVILMDVQMPGCNGIEATQEILKTLKECHILMLTTFDEDEYVVNALKAGATGYLLKDTRANDLISAIRLVHTGHIQMGPTIAPKVLQRLQPFVPKEKQEVLQFLSQREQEILHLVGEGLTNQEIAGKLSLTEGTVKNYVSNVLTHLGVRDRTQAALWAHRHLVVTS